MKMILSMVVLASVLMVGCASRSDLARVEETANKAYTQAVIAKDCCSQQDAKLNEMFKKSQYK